MAGGIVHGGRVLTASPDLLYSACLDICAACRQWQLRQRVLHVPPELHRELFLQAKNKAEESPDMFKAFFAEGKDMKGAALSFFSKMGR